MAGRRYHGRSARYRTRRRRKYGGKLRKRFIKGPGKRNLVRYRKRRQPITASSTLRWRTDTANITSAHSDSVKNDVTWHLNWLNHTDDTGATADTIREAGALNVTWLDTFHRNKAATTGVRKYYLKYIALKGKVIFEAAASSTTLVKLSVVRPKHDQYAATHNGNVEDFQSSRDVQVIKTIWIKPGQPQTFTAGTDSNVRYFKMLIPVNRWMPIIDRENATADTDWKPDLEKRLFLIMNSNIDLASGASAAMALKCYMKKVYAVQES